MHEKEMCPPLTLAQGSELPVNIIWAVLGTWAAIPLTPPEKQRRRMTVPAAVGCWLGYAE